MVEGTGQKFAEATTIVAGVGSLTATLMSIVSIWLQLRYFNDTSFESSSSQCLDPIRDIYEAFTIFTFFQLLINYLDGERALIIMTHGREPKPLLFPLNHCLPPIDISDPHSFLAVKRGILQYAWLKPILGLSAVIMKATGTYHEGKLELKSGYFWSTIIYNFSVTISLYSLGLFWVIMHEDLKPFRPVPKFLCVKLIIFASYWQGFLLSVLVWLGALPTDMDGYTPDNLALAIQDALICIEMPAFAVGHWYAFSWHDFADDTVAAARMPVKYALRDAFGIRDLIEDSKLTFHGNNYAYRDFDSNDKILAHETSRSRMARLRAGMRYERGGKGKYWIASPDKANASDVDPYTPLLGGNSRDQCVSGPSRNNSQSFESSTFEDPTLDPDMENLYAKARQLEYGDWNYPVVPANGLSREDRWRAATPISYGQVPSWVPSYDAPMSPTVASDRGTTQEQPPTVTVTKKKSKPKPKNAPARKRTLSHDQKAPVKPSDDVNDVSRDATGPVSPKSPETDNIKADDEATRLWQQTGGNSGAATEPEDTIASPAYDFQGEAFQNVWGSGDSPAGH
ncbi:duf300 domain containing protein [Grosmannia clavigera kw1407]|uniref:Duf300 domain containing protein n=1 Tax=Grosmannia clavigera (strain kw1407 / UAMH 11150) TaxID=655863 RepID=F0XGD5_GROCL|nr:duf300 domain containing protein [Grosmannia clavigera kw1407]EFX02955.1 duf300 domain containing protein [Grosmannia clavigera kw1407]